MPSALDKDNVPFEIRQAEDHDLPAILDLFKISLGEEGGIPQSGFWKWKHQLNPFGQSPVWIAKDGGRLVGLRTFLCWRFRHQGKTFHAYRAVDTATHPDYRGRGLFRRLTLRLIEDLGGGYPAFVFNTPNRQSLPGYLKMGWQQLGHTPLNLRLFPLRILGNHVLRRAANTPPSDHLEWSRLEDKWNAIALDYQEFFKPAITTDITYDYLVWRYRQIPGFDYHVHMADEGRDTCILIYRIKQGRFRELRLTDVLFNRPNATLLKRCLSELSDQNKPEVITLLEDRMGLLRQIIPFGFVRAYSMGLKVTWRHINSEELSKLVSEPSHWYFSGGSIELL